MIALLGSVHSECRSPAREEAVPPVHVTTVCGAAAREARLRRRAPAAQQGGAALRCWRHPVLAT